MAPPDTLMTTDLPLTPVRRGKVRDVYQCTTIHGDQAMLLVATDRLSAYDVIMPTPVPDKGRVLTSCAAFWFGALETITPHHLISTDANDIAGLSDEQRATLQGRVMLGKRCKVVPIECVVRGYLEGSGWREYTENQSVCGVSLPAGLKRCDRIPQPIFTPATKADEGHDENISFDRACELVGGETMEHLRTMSLHLYEAAHAHALSRGLILADTKFEFGLPLDPNDQTPILIDEALTPDSSRYWPADDYEPGRTQASFDKQFVREYLEDLVSQGKWNKQPPGPELPDTIVEQTRAKYLQAHELITGHPLT